MAKNADQLIFAKEDVADSGKKQSKSVLAQMFLASPPGHTSVMTDTAEDESGTGVRVDTSDETKKQSTTAARPYTCTVFLPSRESMDVVINVPCSSVAVLHHVVNACIQATSAGDVISAAGQLCLRVALSDGAVDHDVPAIDESLPLQLVGAEAYAVCARPRLKVEQGDGVVSANASVDTNSREKSDEKAETSETSERDQEELELREVDDDEQKLSDGKQSDTTICKLTPPSSELSPPSNVTDMPGARVIPRTAARHSLSSHARSSVSASLGTRLEVDSLLLMMHPLVPEIVIGRAEHQAGMCLSPVNAGGRGKSRTDVRAKRSISDDPAVRLFRAAEAGDVDTLRSLLNRGHKHGYQLNARGIDNFTALHFAARKGHLAAVNLILRHPSQEVDIDALTKNDWTALQLAAFQGHYDVCEILLMSGANPTIGSDRVPRALELARQKDFEEVVQLLEEFETQWAESRLDERDSDPAALPMGH